MNAFLTRIRLILCGLFALALWAMLYGPAYAQAQAPTSEQIVLFEQELEALAKANKVPGLSAAIVHKQEVIWARGFGYADLEEQTPATAETPYRLASVSKPFGAILLMQLVEEKKLELDALMNAFTLHPWFEPGSWSGAHFPSRYEEAPITVRHVLSHTSQGTPSGSTYQYNGNIFADLTWVIEEVTKTPYPDVLRTRILDKLGMDRTLPGHLAPWGQDLVQEMPTPYEVTNGAVTPATYPGFGLEPDRDVAPWNLQPAFRLPEKGYAARRAVLGNAYTSLYAGNTASGMISTVLDLAKLDIALDQNSLMTEASKREMFTAQKTPSGATLPYALGWFVEEREDVEFVWHYGWFPPVVSALYLKAPEKEITLLLLSNSDRLSANYAWTQLGVQASPYARLFLKHFVF